MTDIDELEKCNNCLMPEPFARLNEEGLCHACVDHKPPERKGLEALKEEIEQIPKTGKYDCVVGISGGRDSTFALYIIKKKLGLNPLAFNFDNEFAHEVATENMRKSCDNLGVDFLSVGSKKQYRHQIIADRIRATCKLGPEYLLTYICGQCGATGWYTGNKICKEAGTNALISGSSAEEQVPNYFCFNKRVPKAKKLLSPSCPRYLRSSFNLYRIRRELSNLVENMFTSTLGMDRNRTKERPAGQVRKIDIFDYAKWDRREMLRTIQEEMGWRKPEEAASSWRFDCRIYPLLTYCHYKVSGFPRSFLGHMTMIRSGTMTKEEAISHLNSTNWGEFTPYMENFLINELKIEPKYVDIIRSY